MLAGYERISKNTSRGVIPYVAIVPYMLDGAKDELVTDDLGLHSELHKATRLCIQVMIEVLPTGIVCQGMPIRINSQTFQIIAIRRTPAISHHDFVHILKLEMIIPGVQVQPYKTR